MGEVGWNSRECRWDWSEFQRGVGGIVRIPVRVGGIDWNSRESVIGWNFKEKA